jgi:hypothetical protein
MIDNKELAFVVYTFTLFIGGFVSGYAYKSFKNRFKELENGRK